MTATMTHHALSTLPTQGDASTTGVVSGGPLAMLRLEGAAALVCASLAYSGLDGRWGVFALLFLLPDLSMLGYFSGPRIGAASYARYWPNVATSLDDNKIALEGTNGTVSHSAHDFGVFANVSIGYAFDL